MEAGWEWIHDLDEMGTSSSYGETCGDWEMKGERRGKERGDICGQRDGN